jgi:hypothetical protein
MRGKHSGDHRKGEVTAATGSVLMGLLPSATSTQLKHEISVDTLGFRHAFLELATSL